MEEKTMTGYPSIDKPWLKYYSQEALQAPMPECTVFENIYSHNAQHPSDVALTYFGRKITYRALFHNVELANRAFLKLGVKKDDRVALLTSSTPETVYVMLALGLNIAVGIAGQLVLGYVAFYAVGAYTYALLNQAFGIGFWACLPVGGFMAVLFGLALGFPVLRLRGDYLAIVTLGFGEIVRLTLLNWASLTGGSGGIKDIPAPGFFGMDMDINMSTMFVYYIVLAAVIITIVVISRLKNSRVGLALQALREDEIACEAMGINLARVKLSAFALSSCWAGFAGVIFAAKTSFINPASFTFMESAMILSMVVLGGMGSIVGVVIAAMILILAPEYLRAFSEYRMLIFGAIMVIMMIFRPQGLVTGERRRYRITKLHGNAAKDRA